jgi:hypothetical protein
MISTILNLYYLLSLASFSMKSRHKTIIKEAAEQNEHLCATWQIAMAQYDPCQIVCIDEAGVDDQTNIRRRGWAPMGQGACVEQAFCGGRSILPALSLEGIIALDIFKGSVNRVCFLGFLHKHFVYSCIS